MEVSVKITPRRSSEGHPFSEILYTFMQDGIERNALTRLPYLVTDAPFSRAQEAQAFLQRRRRT